MENAFYKLMGNVLYGKTVEKVRNRVDVRLISNKKDFITQKIFDNDLVAIHEIEPKHDLKGLPKWSSTHTNLKIKLQSVWFWFLLV